MKKIIACDILKNINFSYELKTKIEEILLVLNQEYGYERDIERDLGGYVLILESNKDVIEAKENILGDIIPEYIDDIECEGGKQYCLSLFLLSSDYSITVVATKDLTDMLLEEREEGR